MRMKNPGLGGEFGGAVEDSNALALRRRGAEKRPAATRVGQSRMRAAVRRVFPPVLALTLLMPILAGCGGGGTPVETKDVGVEISEACQLVLINGDGPILPCEGVVVDYYDIMTSLEKADLIATGQVTITVAAQP